MCAYYSEDKENTLALRKKILTIGLILLVSSPGFVLLFFLPINSRPLPLLILSIASFIVLVAVVRYLHRVFPTREDG